MSLALAALFALVSLAGGTEWEPTDGQFRIMDQTGTIRLTSNATYNLNGGVPYIRYNTHDLPDEATLMHELRHALDVLDDGILNGSTDPRPAVRPAGVNYYCWLPVEWAACSESERYWKPQW